MSDRDDWASSDPEKVRAYYQAELAQVLKERDAAMDAALLQGPTLLRYREALDKGRCPQCGVWFMDDPQTKERLAALSGETTDE